MPTYVALLRAVNLGGSTELGMAPLVRALEGTGWRNVRSWLRSGNLVLDTDLSPDAAVERRLRADAAKRFGRPLEFFVRSSSRWERIVSENPFPDFAERDPSHLTVLVLQGAPSAAAWKSLDAAIEGREEVQGAGDLAYITFPEGIGPSRLTMGRIEKALGTRGTLRNWNTVRKLREMSRAPDPGGAGSERKPTSGRSSV